MTVKSMNIITVDSGANLHQSQSEFFLISSSDEAPALAGFELGQIRERGEGNSTLLSTPDDFHDTRGVLLTADSTIEDVENITDQALVNLFVIHVANFVDGRVFSLVRQIRALRAHAEILIAGEFGLDQAAYFYKSGANGFIVHEPKIDTLKHTLADLKTAHQGTSAAALPMFR
ncbi:hypothetical protein B0181_04550 [Moraxella caviae]|uniref:Uncharacterized protein conserved in bacteria n=1 Tax=Moraxella caviae TaxID=34060 RepID=A0A1T0A4Q6_9GAMM|nr:DUF934 domain-containing protein [Moraxella caviae]OOR90694.1 hypothetical protein B0181_04550 [Moraxella caviae]STZ14839.1 Uncharacterized protein conserved in bacteria [Moraxella caviae]VEW11268.1 Uncharacterized protein conserved in bacteria [Moraxella caviae]